jgi:hypothetical protein
MTVEELAAKGLRVKPLIWAEVCESRSDEDPRMEHTGGYEAESAFGSYVIDVGWGSDCYYWSVVDPEEFDIGSNFEDPEYAKAAAEADHATRIAAMIEQERGY